MEKNDQLIEVEHLQQVALTAARKAAAIIIQAAGQPKTVDFKGATDLVTATDRKSEETIKNVIRSSFPDHRILAEESGQTCNNSDYLWIIDPLDGTTNFVHGYPSYAVSIAVYHQTNPVIGVVIELPANNEYYAVINQGATCNGEPIEVSKVDNLSRSLLVTGFGYEHGQRWAANMKLFRKLTDITQGVRRLGAAAVDLCHVACGKVDGFWEFDLHPWDTAAGLLVLTEAGGRITDMNGDQYSIFKNNMLATNGLLHNLLIDALEPNIGGLVD